MLSQLACCDEIYCSFSLFAADLAVFSFPSFGEFGLPIRQKVDKADRNQ
jgi:hypothetical protein